MATASLISCCTKGFLRNLASSVQVALLVLTVILPSAGFAQTPLENPRPKRTFQAVRGTQVQGTSRPVANQPSQTVPSQQELPPLTQAQQELIGAARTDADRLLASTWDSFNRQQLQLRELTSNAAEALERQTPDVAGECTARSGSGRR